MSKMFPQFDSLAYKRFNWHRKIQYFKFFMFHNAEYDQCFLVEILILKLTFMGLQFAKFGVIIDEERRKQVHSIWETRKRLKKFNNAFEILYEQASKKFKEKYGFAYESEMIWEDKNDGSDCSEYKGSKIIAPVPITVEQSNEMEEYFREAFPFEAEYNLEKQMINEACELIKENIFGWWD